MAVQEPSNESIDGAGATSGDARDVFRRAVSIAVLAPSGHNTQPWRFVIRGDRLELWADRSRRLPVVDPDDRELVVSCGAALAYLRLALENAGFAPAVDVLPEGPAADLLAVITLPDHLDEAGARADELEAMGARRTNRSAYEDRPVPDELLTEMQARAAAAGAWLRSVPAGAAREARTNPSSWRHYGRASRRSSTPTRRRSWCCAWAMHPRSRRNLDGHSTTCSPSTPGREHWRREPTRAMGGSMDVQELLGKASDAVSVGRAFGPAYEKDGCLVIPVAWVAGGGGGGKGEGPSLAGATDAPADLDEDAEPGDGRPIGAGGGFGAVAWPIGAYVVKDGEVRWIPALDLTRLLVGAVAVIRVLVRVRARRRARSAR